MLWAAVEGAVTLGCVVEELRASADVLWSSAERAIRSRKAFFIIRLHSSWQSWSFGNLDTHRHSPQSSKAIHLTKVKAQHRISLLNTDNQFCTKQTKCTANLHWCWPATIHNAKLTSQRLWLTLWRHQRCLNTDPLIYICRYLQFFADTDQKQMPYSNMMQRQIVRHGL